MFSNLFLFILKGYKLIRVIRASRVIYQCCYGCEGYQIHKRPSHYSSASLPHTLHVRESHKQFCLNFGEEAFLHVSFQPPQQKRAQNFMQTRDNGVSLFLLRHIKPFVCARVCACVCVKVFECVCVCVCAHADVAGIWIVRVVRLFRLLGLLTVIRVLLSSCTTHQLSKSSEESKVSGNRKFSRAQSSCKLFCKGVPGKGKEEEEQGGG